MANEYRILAADTNAFGLSGNARINAAELRVFGATGNARINATAIEAFTTLTVVTITTRGRFFNIL